MIVRVAINYDGQPEWVVMMAIDIEDPADLVPALHALADECWEAAAFEQIASRSGLNDQL